MLTQFISFDIYGTLVDVEAIQHVLLPHLDGDEPLARRISELWREKNLEYSFRRALMRRYEPFPVCSREALDYCCAALRVDLSENQRKELQENYQKLPAYAEVADALQTLRARQHVLAAFSNGPEESLRPMLAYNGLRDHFDQLISTDDRQTFKPDPAAYAYLHERLGGDLARTWLVSSNPFDVIGAKAFGLRAAWIQRSSEKTFDPWEGFSPDLTVPDLAAFAAEMRP